MEGFDAEGLKGLIAQGMTEGKVPFIIPNRANLQRSLDVVREAYPNLRYLHSREDLLGHLRNGSQSGFIFDTFGNYVWPLETSFGTFFGILTGDSLTDLDRQTNPRFIPVATQPRILLSLMSPEFSINDWRRMFGSHMNGPQIQELKSVSQRILQSLQIIYVGGNDAHARPFHQWLQGGNRV